MSEETTTALAIAYEKDYEIDDEAFIEPFVVLKPVNREGFAWWNGKLGEKKVVKIIAALKADLIVHEACVFAGISVGQYKYFTSLHPEFLAIKHRLKSVVALQAKIGLSMDIKNPLQAKTRQWYLERKQPELYGRNIGASITAPPGATTKLTGEAFLDEEGTVLLTRQTAELLDDDYGTSKSQQGSAPQNI